MSRIFLLAVPAFLCSSPLLDASDTVLGARIWTDKYGRTAEATLVGRDIKSSTVHLRDKTGRVHLIPIAGLSVSDQQEVLNGSARSQAATPVAVVQRNEDPTDDELTEDQLAMLAAAFDEVSDRIAKRQEPKRVLVRRRVCVAERCGLFGHRIRYRYRDVCQYELRPSEPSAADQAYAMRGQTSWRDQANVVTKRARVPFQQLAEAVGARLDFIKETVTGELARPVDDLGDLTNGVSLESNFYIVNGRETQHLVIVLIEDTEATTILIEVRTQQRVPNTLDYRPAKQEDSNAALLKVRNALMALKTP